MTKEIQCLIWDCDGCLIDSEVIACQSSAKIVSEMGYPISTESYIERFAGMGLKDTLRYLEKETGRAFLDIFPRDRLHRERSVLFETSLKPIEGIPEILDALALPMCIASGSEPARLKQTLEITKLYERFDGRIYSASEVEKGKPAPDIFLYAAKKMGFAPDACLVIEDSPNGIRAAQAARMDVFAFCGGGHISPRWMDKVKATGVEVLFGEMRELPELLKKRSTPEAPFPPRNHL